MASEIKSLQGSSKILAIKLVEDPEVQASLKHSLVEVVRAPEVKEALVGLI